MPKRNSQKPLASLSLDLDNQWSYMKIHGDEGWDAFPSYLDTIVPRALKFLSDRALRITFFIVGQDAALEKNHQAIRSIAEAGHEIGNHSFHHESWLHLYSEPEIEAEIERAEQHIEQVTGQRPTGFRGPGYSFSPAVLNVLKRRGYKYDASTFPTYLGPLARAYYFMTSDLSAEEKEQRKALFGGFKEGLQPLKPYQWCVEKGNLEKGNMAKGTDVLPQQTLTEIPVTTMPIVKVPIHFSYVLYLSVFSPALAVLYFRIALLMCKLTGTQPSMLLHPLDFLGKEDVPALAFFPGMSLSSEQKLKTLGRVLDLLNEQFTVLPVGDHAEKLGQQSLPTFEPENRTLIREAA